MSAIGTKNEHSTAADQCPLSGVKQTSRGLVAMSAFDPKRTYYRKASRRFVDDLLRRVVDYYGCLEILELGLAPEGGLDSFLKLRPVP